VNVIQTEFEGQARGLVESLDGVVDAIVVAGGDGTVSEVTIGCVQVVPSAVWFYAGEFMCYFWHKRTIHRTWTGYLFNPSHITKISQGLVVFIQPKFIYLFIYYCFY
jgi:hypothetical protein